MNEPDSVLVQHVMNGFIMCPMPTCQLNSYAVYCVRKFDRYYNGSYSVNTISYVQYNCIYIYTYVHLCTQSTCVNPLYFSVCSFVIVAHVSGGGVVIINDRHHVGGATLSSRVWVKVKGGATLIW